jgi:hypothetical protein
VEGPFTSRVLPAVVLPLTRGPAPAVAVEQRGDSDDRVIEEGVIGSTGAVGKGEQVPQPIADQEQSDGELEEAEAGKDDERAQDEEGQGGEEDDDMDEGGCADSKMEQEEKEEEEAAPELRRRMSLAQLQRMSAFLREQADVTYFIRKIERGEPYEFHQRMVHEYSIMIACGC